jgi:hypothetical protein
VGGGAADGKDVGGGCMAAEVQGRKAEVVLGDREVEEPLEMVDHLVQGICWKKSATLSSCTLTLIDCHV